MKIGTFENVVRIVTACQIFFFTSIFVSTFKRGQKTLIVATFYISIIAYVLRVYVKDDSQYHFITYAFYLLIFAIPWLIWLVSKALFDDEFSLKPLHFVHLIYIEILNFVYFFHHVSMQYSFLPHLKDGWYSYIIQSLPYLLQLIFSALALVVAFRDVNTDLLNPRLRFRKLFISLAGGLLLFVTTVELASVGQPESTFFQILFVILIFVITYYFSIRAIDFSNSFFLQKSKAAEEKIQIDQQLMNRFEDLVKKDKVYLEPEASVHLIARSLQEPEYKVRHMINTTMGFRNFNDFLNHYRVEEAKMRLTEEAAGDESILGIAYAIGYNSLAPFNKAFKRITGLAPSEYRKKSFAGKEK